MMVIQNVHFFNNFNNRSPVSCVTLLVIILANSHLNELDSNMFKLKSFEFSLILSFVLKILKFSENLKDSSVINDNSESEEITSELKNLTLLLLF